MQTLSSEFQPLPGPVKVATLLSLAPGQVFVSADQAGTSDLPGGRRTVLVTKGGGPLELITSNTSPPVTEAGTYLDASDLARLGGAIADPKIREYGMDDTWRKMRSGAGMLLAVGALATLATAIVGLVLALTAPLPAAMPDVATVQDVLAWTTAPLENLRNAPANPSKLEASRRRIKDRITRGDDCLALLSGSQAPPSKIPGVKCSPPRTSGWSAQTVGGVITAVIGILTAILGFLAIANKYGFRESPA